MIPDFSIDRAKAFIRSTRMNRDELTAFLWRFTGQFDAGAFSKRIADELVRAARPEDAVPEIYADYRRIVHDGIGFLLSRFSLKRLVDIAVTLILGNETATPEDHLMLLARDVPTLHKLGQVIARNRHVAPEVRQRLIRLENRMHTGDIEALKTTVSEELHNYLVPLSVVPEDRMLSEASVGAVAGFAMTDPVSGENIQGVFKVLKPGVREKLAEEFEILDQLACFFDKNRSEYPLKDFTFIETFRDVRDALAEEINLCGEQAHLKAAAVFYRNMPVKIPALLPLCTGNITVMSRINGHKITDAPMSAEERTRCARLLFEAVVWRPLFSEAPETLFHGDPHAGNLFAERDSDGTIWPVLLDWSLAGTLSRKLRRNVIRLMLGIFAGDDALVCRTIGRLAENGSSPRPDISRMVSAIRAEDEFRRFQKTGKAFYLIDRTAIRGVRYPKALLLFRKAFFTLDGVLHELDPDFDMDATLFRLGADLFADELPNRVAGLFCPFTDRAEKYKSLLSNRDIAMAALRFPGTGWFAVPPKPLEMLTACARQMNPALGLFMGSGS